MKTDTYNRLDEVRDHYPELAEAIDKYINTIASHQELIDIYSPSFNCLHMANLELMEEAIRLVHQKASQSKEDMMAWSKRRRESHRNQ